MQAEVGYVIYCRSLYDLVTDDEIYSNRAAVTQRCMCVHDCVCVAWVQISLLKAESVLCQPGELSLTVQAE